MDERTPFDAKVLPKQRTLVLGDVERVAVSELYAFARAWLASEEGILSPVFLSAYVDESSATPTVVFHEGWTLSATRPVEVVGGRLVAEDRRGQPASPVAEHSKVPIKFELGVLAPRATRGLRTEREAIRETIRALRDRWVLDAEARVIRCIEGSRDPIDVQALYWLSRELWLEKPSASPSPALMQGEVSARRGDPGPALKTFFWELSEGWSLDGDAVAALTKGPLLQGTTTLVSAAGPPFVHRVELRNFKCFSSLDIDLHRETALEGHWTCIAGINGAGKSAVLQAIAIACLGEAFAPELGRTAIEDLTTYGADAHAVDLVGPTTVRWTWPEPDTVGAPQLLVLGYGASRNLTDREDPSDESRSLRSRQVQGLFRPFSRVPSADDLFSDEEAADARGRRLARKLVEEVLGEELRIDEEGVSVRASGAAADSLRNASLRPTPTSAPRSATALSTARSSSMRQPSARWGSASSRATCPPTARSPCRFARTTRWACPTAQRRAESSADFDRCEKSAKMDRCLRPRPSVTLSP